MAFLDWRGRAARLTHQSLSGQRAEGLLAEARVVFTNQLSNSLQLLASARQPGGDENFVICRWEIWDLPVRGGTDSPFEIALL